VLVRASWLYFKFGGGKPMKKMLVLFVLGLAVPLLAAAQTTEKAAVSKGTAAQGEDVAAQLKALENAWSDAVLKHDAAALDAILEDSLVETSPTGTVSNKAMDLADLKAGEPKLESFSPDNMKVHVYGNAAVVTGRFTLKGTYKGKDISGTGRFTDTFVKRNGKWRCVASQATMTSQK
jgi:ketosteroid isomerase-like protein